MADLLTLAARVPDHGKLEPWRFVVLGRQTLDAMAPLLARRGPGRGAGSGGGGQGGLGHGVAVIVAVVFSPVDSPKVPEWEQVLSTGARCAWGWSTRRWHPVGAPPG